MANHDKTGPEFWGPDPDATQPLPPREAVDDELIARLRARTSAFARYEVDEKLGEGGMGTIFRVTDLDLRRQLALKVVRGDELETPRARAARTARLITEARVQGQLDHPGVVPVHDIGLDADEHLFFTMPVVKGDTLTAVFDKTRRGASDWSQTRVVGVILRVCETMAFAHDREVVHRDLKPDNVMVGRFGETYVMDWGLARVGGIPDPAVAMTQIEVESETRGRDKTQSGSTLGTPSYMPPEQARGDLKMVGPKSDVYAIGAMLYEMLAGARPYDDVPDAVDNRAVLELVKAGPPTPLAELAPRADRQLVAICHGAMERELGERIESAEALADNLRAYLDGKVAPVYPGGPIDELVAWVRRHKGVAALLVTLVIVVLLAIVTVTEIQRRNAIVRQLDGDERAAVWYLAEAERLYPVHPDTVRAMDAWLEAVEDLLSRRAMYQARLEDLGQGGVRTARRDDLDSLGERLRLLKNFRDMSESNLQKRRQKANDPVAEREAMILDHELALADRAIKRLDEEQKAGGESWATLDADDQESFDRLAELVRNIDRLAAAEVGVAERVRARRRDAFALGGSNEGANKAAWVEAIASIGNRDECPRYNGLKLEPQIGLVPLGRNPASGLWEFWHTLSGKRPDPKAAELEPGAGMVFILLPGGAYTMGRPIPEGEDKAIAGTPEVSVHLDPFFLSKYEMTQQQWAEATDGARPSESFPTMKVRGGEVKIDGDPDLSALLTEMVKPAMVSHTHPVEQVSYTDCDEVLRRWNLEIPTCAQWEYAASGSTDHRAEPDALAGPVNFFDASTSLLSTSTGKGGAAGGLAETSPSDGYPDHAPVDAFLPDDLGFYNLFGNVREWTRDWYSPSFLDCKGLPGTGEIIPHYSNARTLRGGGFEDPISKMTVKTQFKAVQDGRDEDIGIRPGRALEPGTWSLSQDAASTGGGDDHAQSDDKNAGDAE